MTARASDTGLAMFFTDDTAPLLRVRPSIIMASSSTSPSAFSAAPWPTSKEINSCLHKAIFSSNSLKSLLKKKKSQTFVC